MKLARLLSAWLLLISLAMALLPAPVLAQTEPEKIELTPTYPKLQANAGGSFAFEVAIAYTGEKPKVFDLRVTAPSGWDVYMTPQFDKEKKISSITLQPAAGGRGDTVAINANAPIWPIPNPGEYKINFEAISSTVKGSTTLTAEIVNRFMLRSVAANERLNTFATTGKDNFFSIKVQNLSTAAVNNINFSATNKPEGWTIEFKPDKIDALNALDEKSVDINIKPPARAIAGDYMLGVRASGKEATADEMNIRVTVESPTVWGWVGVGIILVVVLGLIGVFMRFSRR